jgi:hypothetical protein
LLSEFSNPAGLVFIPQIKKCFITGHYVLETKFSLERWNMKIGQVINQLKTYINAPFIDSAIDLVNTRLRRNARSPRLSKASKPQAFTFASIHKFIVYLENYAVPLLFNGFLTLFQNSKPTFYPFSSSPYKISRKGTYPTTLPNFDQTNQKAYIDIADPLDENVWNIYLTTLTKLNEPTNDLELEGGTITYNISLNPFNDQLLQLEHTIDILTELIEQATETLQRLQQNLLPTHAYDYDDLSRMIEEILKTQTSPLFTTKQMLDYLHTHRHTFVVRDDCQSTVTTPQCSMYITTFLPIVNMQYCYMQYSIQTFPIIKPGIITDDWIKIQTPEKSILINDFTAKIIDPSNHQCFEDEDHSFQLCIVERKIIQTPSRCFERLLHTKTLQETLRYCSYEKLNYVTDQATFIDSDSIAYTNPNPGSIIERCPTVAASTHHLPPHGILHMNPDCDYEMVNGPLTQEDSYHPFLTIANRMEHSAVIIHDPNSQEILTHHVQEYAVYYISGLASSILLLLLSITLYCGYGKRIPCCIICLRRQQPAAQRSIITRQPPPRPTAPSIISQDQPYRQIQNQLQQLVRSHLATTAI